MKSFAELLQKLAKDVHGKKQHGHFSGEPPIWDNSFCWLCEQSLDSTEELLHHCQATGQFLGYVHSKCNLKRSPVNYIPVVANHLSIMICIVFAKIYIIFLTTKIQAILLIGEKYISLSIGVKVETYIDSRGKEKRV